MPSTPAPSFGRRPRIAVIGAGISGLAAGWKLRNTAPDVDFTIFEKADRVGGIIGTRKVGDFLCELSVDNFITTAPHGLDLCKELGFESELQSTNNQYRRTFVVRNRKLYPLPDGFMTMAPTKFYPMIVTPLLTPWGKLRCGLELLLPRRKSDEEESLASFATRRLGKEAFERIIEPLVGDLRRGRRQIELAGDPAPIRRDGEERPVPYLVDEKSMKKARADKRQEESGALPFFITLKCGLQELTERLADRIGATGSRSTTPLPESNTLKKAAGTCSTRTSRPNGSTRSSSRPIPARRARRFGNPEAAEIYGQTDHTGAAIIHRRRKRPDRQADAGMGFVVPTPEGNGVIAGSFSSHKYPTRAPEGKTLLRSSSAARAAGNGRSRPTTS